MAKKYTDNSSTVRTIFTSHVDKMCNFQSHSEVQSKQYRLIPLNYAGLTLLTPESAKEYRNFLKDNVRINNNSKPVVCVTTELCTNAAFQQMLKLNVSDVQIRQGNVVDTEFANIQTCNLHIDLISIK